MKHISRLMIFCMLAVTLTACPTDEEKETKDNSGNEHENIDENAVCLNTSQIHSSGYTFDNIFVSSLLVGEKVYLNDELIRSYRYTSNDRGLIESAIYTDEKTDVEYTPVLITYNSAGKWVERVQVGTNATYVSRAEYNSQNQIIKYTSVERKNGAESITLTVEYEWTGENNTGYTYTSPTLHTVLKNEFYLDKLDKLKEVSEKTAFQYFVIKFNKNLLKRQTFKTTHLSDGKITNVVKNYVYEFNNAGYPTTAAETSITDGSSYTNNVIYKYDCK